MIAHTRAFRLLAPALACFAAAWSGCTGPTAMQKESPPKIDSAPPSPGGSQSPGRYQLVSAGNTVSTFLIDTSTG